MYHRIKKIILSLIPKRKLFQLETFLRSLYYLMYKGNNNQCTVCNKKLKLFIPTNNEDLICPNCGSIARNRRFWKLFTEEYYKENQSILDFSPSRNIYRAFKKTENIQYASSDLSGDFISEKQYDITAIDALEQNFDIIVCYHILEHVIDDEKAMKELYRVLKSGGTCIIQTPFKEGETYENYSITSDIEREKHFGQSDHVRIYSVNGLKNRLENAGFKVQAQNFINDNYFGLKNETILICNK